MIDKIVVVPLNLPGMKYGAPGQETVREKALCSVRPCGERGSPRGLSDSQIEIEERAQEGCARRERRGRAKGLMGECEDESQC